MICYSNVLFDFIHALDCTDENQVASRDSKHLRLVYWPSRPQTLSVIASAAIIALNYNYTAHNRARFEYSLLILIRNKNRFAIPDARDLDTLAEHCRYLIVYFISIYLYTDYLILL